MLDDPERIRDTTLTLMAGAVQVFQTEIDN
jgi:hypothetical protein